MSMQFPIVHIKNLPFSHNPKDLYTLMGQFGNIQEVRAPTSNSNTSSIDVRGQAFVTYTTLKAANLAVEKLSGFNYHGRYLVVRLYNPDPHVVRQLVEEAK
jgi:RNA recognition motif-containing protein